jgi:hypothetical protein
MRHLWRALQHRTARVVGGATLTVLLLPVTASAASVKVPVGHPVNHATAPEDAGSITLAATDLVVVLAIAAAVLLVVLWRRLDTAKAPRARAARRTSAS